MTQIPDPPSFETDLYNESLISARTMLVVDIGDAQVRGVLFEPVDNRYQMVASARQDYVPGASSALILDSVRAVLKELGSIINKRLLADNLGPILPSRPDGSGVDDFIVTVSISEPIKVLLAGLVGDVSIASTERLAQTTFCTVTRGLDMSSIPDPLAALDTILQTHPDLIILAGGIEDGASEPLLELLDLIKMGCGLFQESERPVVLYSGNRAVGDAADEILEGTTNLVIAPNVRPALHTQDLTNAHVSIAEATIDIRCQKNQALRTLSNWSNGNLLHEPAGYGRIIRFLSKSRSSMKGVFGVNITDRCTTYAASFNGGLALGVNPRLGLGSGALMLGEDAGILDRIVRWMPVDIATRTVSAYLHNKSLFPESIPYTETDLYIEQALARIILQNTIREYHRAQDQSVPIPAGTDHLPPVEPIVAGGRILTAPEDPVNSMLILLDGLQPLGATTLVLDPHQLVSALGAAAGINPAIAIQVLNSTAFTHLGTAISLSGDAKPGSPILRAYLVDQDGFSMPFELKLGEIVSLPLKTGRSARLKLHPLQNFDIGMGGPGIGGELLVKGGRLGIVLDGRGRPFLPPSDPAQRTNVYQHWRQTLGG